MFCREFGVFFTWIHVENVLSFGLEVKHAISVHQTKTTYSCNSTRSEKKESAQFLLIIMVKHRVKQRTKYRKRKSFYGNQHTRDKTTVNVIMTMSMTVKLNSKITTLVMLIYLLQMMCLVHLLQIMYLFLLLHQMLLLQKLKVLIPRHQNKWTQRSLYNWCGNSEWRYRVIALSGL